MKEKQFFKSCLKPTHIKSFPSWILKQSLIWDDKNNLSWQMAGCCHPLCCLELNGSYINTTKPLPCLEKHLTWRAAACLVVLKGPRTREQWHSHAGRWRGWAWLGHPGRWVMLLTHHRHNLRGWAPPHLLLIYATCTVQCGLWLHVILTKGPRQEVPRIVAAWKQERGNAHSGSWNTPAEMTHLSCSHVLAKASHMSASDFGGVGKWNRIVRLGRRNEK